jgi:phosphohistidine phosphatase
MHQLILLRHAKASPDAAGGADHERALTESGRRAAETVGRRMRDAGLIPDVVLVSSARRTQQTLEALQQAGLWDDWPNVDTLPGLYMAGVAQLKEFMRAIPETVRSALIIGHNPGLHELALQLAGPAGGPAQSRLAEGYPTASLAEFMIPTAWARIGQGTSLQRFVQPLDIG